MTSTVLTSIEKKLNVKIVDNSEHISDKQNNAEEDFSDIPSTLFETDVAVAVAGSVDSGKSSLIGVLYSGELDNGNGSARATVAKHQHEIKSGKTSDISTRIIKCDNGRNMTLVDLCGHEKYLKTTAFGITGYFPDYAIVVVAANRGILKMTKEHLGILIYMKVPIIIVITRGDIAPEEIYEKTVKDIRMICKIYNKKPEVINSYKDASLPENEFSIKEKSDLLRVGDIADKIQNTCDYVPVITVSNKTGYYINVLKHFISNLKPRTLWDASKLDGSVFYIDSVFNPPGIGIVLSGIVKGKPIKVGDNLFLGPQGKNFIPVRVRSMHSNTRTIVKELQDHQRGCIAIAPIGNIDLVRKTIQKGMIIVSSEKLTDNICYRFKAEIEILHHSATIIKNYTPVIHVGTVRQAARIVNIENILFRKEILDNKKKTIEKITNPTEKEQNEKTKTTLDEKEEQEVKDKEKDNLRTGDKAIVTFKFKFKPEFIEKGLTFFFKEGTTRGKGDIIEIVPVSKDIDPNPDPQRVKRPRFKRRAKHTKTKTT
jgi:elongation factor 1-alpha